MPRLARASRPRVPPGVRGVLAVGTAGSALMGASAWLLVPTLRRPHVAATSVWSGAGQGVQSVATLLYFAGVVTLLMAWLRLGRTALARELPVAAVLWASVLWAVPLLLSPPLGSQDIYSYLAQGRIASLGLDAYTVTPDALPGPLSSYVSSSWLHTTAPYGPAFLALAAAIGGTTGDHVWYGVAAWRGIAVCGLVATAWLLIRVVGRSGSTAVPLWLVVANPLVLLHLLSGAHNELLVVPLVLLGALAAQRRGRLLVLVPIALGTAVLVKATALVFIPFVLLLATIGRSRWARARDVAALGAGCAAVMALLTLVSGYGVGWVRSAQGSAGKGSRLSITSSAGDLLATLFGHHRTDGLAGALQFAGLAVAAGVAVLLLVRAARASPAEQLRILGLAGAAAVAVSLLAPVVHPWYVVPGVVMLAVAGLGERAVLALSALGCLLLRPQGSEILHTRFPLALATGVAAIAVVGWYARVHAVGRSGPLYDRDVATRELGPA